MGNEFGQTSEWNYKSELDWELLQHAAHHNLQECVRSLNFLYKEMPALYQNQFEHTGFEWIDTDSREKGILMFKRKGKLRKDDLLVILNMTVQPQRGWTKQVTGKTAWKEIFNSDSKSFWGSGDYMNEIIKCTPVDKKAKLYEIKFDVPALGAIVFR